MKDRFPGHFTKETIDKELWDECIFVLDTNIILNLYRYSDETRNSFIEVFNAIKERIWIPYRVATEYLENRLEVIYQQESEYEKAITEIRNLKTKLENTRRHPFISNSTMEEVSKNLEKACEELENNKLIHNNRIKEDEIKDIISDILSDERIGEKKATTEIEEIIREGEERYKQKTPPGYSDAKKQSTDDSTASKIRPYGDLIIWKCIIEHAKKSAKPVIFITDDGKEDWWLRFKGKTIGPRPELIEEFKQEVNKEFYMYLPERFLSFASENLSKKPSEEMIAEIVDLRKKEESNSNITKESWIVRAQKALESDIQSLSEGAREREEDENYFWENRIRSLASELQNSNFEIKRLTDKERTLEVQISFIMANQENNTDQEQTIELNRIKNELILTRHDIALFNNTKNKIIRELNTMKPS